MGLKILSLNGSKKNANVEYIFLYGWLRYKFFIEFIFLSCRKMKKASQFFYNPQQRKSTDNNNH